MSYKTRRERLNELFIKRDKIDEEIKRINNEQTEEDKKKIKEYEEKAKKENYKWGGQE